jgi:hypothetical protein
MRAVVLTASLAIIAGCGGGNGSPTTPPATVNTAPTIESLVTASERAEADRPVQITAVVKDTESQLSQMTYTWSAAPQSGLFGGVTSFTGSEATNTWRAPKGQLSPDLYTVMLTVTESFTSAGQPKQNTVSRTATVHYNDSPEEVKELGFDFLVRKFGNFNVTAADAVSNFSDNCPGKASEKDEIVLNRENFHILSAQFHSPVASFNADLTIGEVEGPCTFEDIPNSGPNMGKREFVSGTCLLKTVYENFRWRLCESNFNGPYSTAIASLRGRVPGGPYDPRLLIRSGNAGK